MYDRHNYRDLTVEKIHVRIIKLFLHVSYKIFIAILKGHMYDNYVNAIQVLSSQSCTILYTMKELLHGSSIIIM